MAISGSPQLELLSRGDSGDSGDTDVPFVAMTFSLEALVHYETIDIRFRKETHITVRFVIISCEASLAQ